MIEKRGKLPSNNIMREHKFMALHKEQEQMSETKHDGKLGKHEVEIWKEFVIIEEADGWMRDEPEYAQLTAEQALSLLAWLEENKPVIEQLAKENNPTTD